MLKIGAIGTIIFVITSCNSSSPTNDLFERSESVQFPSAIDSSDSAIGSQSPSTDSAKSAIGSQDPSTGNQIESVSGRRYPSDVRSTFKTNCQISAAASSGLSRSAFTDICECLLRALEQDYSFEEFTKAEQDMLAGRASGIDMEYYGSLCV
jgi:hypothetical protein